VVYFKLQNPYEKFTLKQVMKDKRGSRSISTISLTSALDEGGWSTPTPGRFTPGKETRYPLCTRLGGSQDRSERVWKMSAVPEFDSRNVQPVASRYTDWAIPAHAVPLLIVVLVIQTGRDNNETLFHSSVKQMYPRNQYVISVGVCVCVFLCVCVCVCVCRVECDNTVHMAS
jgi:hypothetical protein